MLHCSRTPKPSPPTDSGSAALRTPDDASADHSRRSRRSSASSSSRRRSLVTRSETIPLVRPARSCWASVGVKSIVVVLTLRWGQAEGGHGDDVALHLVGSAAEREDQRRPV